MRAYPEHVWDRMRWLNKPGEFWSQPERVRQFVDQLARKLQVTKDEDWYRISRQQVEEQPGGTRLLQRYGGLHGILSVALPEKSWDLGGFAKRGKKAAQRWLKLKVSEIFPEWHVLEDYRHPQLVLPSSQHLAELDLYLPELNLAFEYQGEHHYVDTPVMGHLELYKEHDQQKRQLCERVGITLIEVPYWWDKEISSLRESILASCKGNAKIESIVQKVATH
jgi:hypothetical protein